MAGDRVEDADRTVGWGMLATGRIAQSFARDLREVPEPGWSRSAHGRSRPPTGSRRSTATTAAGPTAPTGPWSRTPPSTSSTSPPRTRCTSRTPGLALEAGKHVLCEKPLTLNRADAEEMVGLAREHDRFLMEAMWMACHPVIRAVVAGLRTAASGHPRQVHADLGFVVDGHPGDRLLDPALGAGALLDMGIYPLTLADLLLGPVTERWRPPRCSTTAGSTSTSRSPPATRAAASAPSPPR